MKTVKMDQNDPDLDLIDEAVEVLSPGGVILYPTDTVYGLGANIFNEKAVEKVYNIKNRDYIKPLSVCVSSVEEVHLIAVIPAEYENSLSKYLPGPFTFIFNKTDSIPDYFAKNHKIGVRIPKNEISRKLAQNFPITSTSANLSGKKTLKSPKEILSQLNEGIDFIVDVGSLEDSVPSTVVDLTRKKPNILRQGTGIFN
ncbi:Threonylcarbamoyl-AMP synthase [Candidatus Methanobinarius endosymbioticus]|uniref:L-threonylcarbamoyladenylate synthase n=1 Tax=Candidatus Methanobinarius endosymbioticus TaxID=2006182 RepID=A0A366MCH0_9EURY|nr:Threonylcarbamoyl-AMP synthase [Candidatus Methanobinarius endosymbioticus]